MNRPTHPRPLPGGEQSVARPAKVPLLGGVRGAFQSSKFKVQGSTLDVGCWMLDVEISSPPGRGQGWVHGPNACAKRKRAAHESGNRSSIAAKDRKDRTDRHLPAAPEEGSAKLAEKEERLVRRAEPITLELFEQKPTKRTKGGLPLCFLRFLLWICGSSFLGWARISFPAIHCFSIRTTIHKSFLELRKFFYHG